MKECRRSYIMVDGKTYTNTTNCGDCLHSNGWFITVEVSVFWLFTVTKRIFVCSDCGEQK